MTLGLEGTKHPLQKLHTFSGGCIIYTYIYILYIIPYTVYNLEFVAEKSTQDDTVNGCAHIQRGGGGGVERTSVPLCHADHILSIYTW